MKLGVLTACLYDRPLAEALAHLKTLGVQAVELGAGGYPGTDHCNPEILLNDSAEFGRFKETIANSGLTISALSCHGNAVHPQADIAQKFNKDFENCVILAEKLGIDTVVTFSGCPGDHPGAKYPNWVTCPWPEDYSIILEYQWNECLIPYWKRAAAFAKSHGVNKIALELHPGMSVYHTESLLRLREAVGPEIGANLDPSHLFWQGMDVPAVIRALEGAIFHFHAKDSRVYEANAGRNGVLDTKSYGNEKNRSWLFRTVGYGQSADVWKDIFSTLRLVGYDYVVSIEHEDSLMSGQEGLSKAVDFLKNTMIFEEQGEMYWA